MLQICKDLYLLSLTICKKKKKDDVMMRYEEAFMTSLRHYVCPFFSEPRFLFTVITVF